MYPCIVKDYVGEDLAGEGRTISVVVGNPGEFVFIEILITPLHRELFFIIVEYLFLIMIVIL